MFPWFGVVFTFLPYRMDISHRTLSSFGILLYEYIKFLSAFFRYIRFLSLWVPSCLYYVISEYFFILGWYHLDLSWTNSCYIAIFCRQLCPSGSEFGLRTFTIQKIFPDDGVQLHRSILNLKNQDFFAKVYSSRQVVFATATVSRLPDRDIFTYIVSSSS